MTRELTDVAVGNSAEARKIPAVGYLVLGDPPYLQAHSCRSCGALYFNRRNGCARCGGVEFGVRRLSNHGVVRAFTIVHRASPSVPTPYTAVIVDLDGGGVVKANLLDVTDPSRITPGLRVKMATFIADTDDDGTEAIAFGYKMAEDGQ